MPHRKVLNEYFSQFGLELPEDVNAPLIVVNPNKLSFDEWSEKLRVNYGSMTNFDFSLQVEPESPYKITPLEFLVKMNNVEGLSKLLSLNPSLDNVSTSGSSALDIALQRGNTEMVKLLCAHGAKKESTGTGMANAWSHLMVEGNESYVRKWINQIGPMLKILKEHNLLKHPEYLSFQLPDIKELSELFLKIHQVIQKELQLAKAEYRSLMVLLPEHHRLKYSLLIEIFVLYACELLGINTILPEINQKRIDIWNARCMEDSSYGYHDYGNIMSLLPIAAERGWNQLFVDMPSVGGGGDNNNLELRNLYISGMAQLNVKKDALMVIGAKHTKGLLETCGFNNQKFRVLTICGLPENLLAKADLESVRSKLHCFTVKGNPDLWDAATVCRVAQSVVKETKLFQEKRATSELSSSDKVALAPIMMSNIANKDEIVFLEEIQQAIIENRIVFLERAKALELLDSAIHEKYSAFSWHFEQWKRQYRELHPNKEREGYGPGALVKYQRQRLDD